MFVLYFGCLIDGYCVVLDDVVCDGLVVVGGVLFGVVVVVVWVLEYFDCVVVVLVVLLVWIGEFELVFVV